MNENMWKSSMGVFTAALVTIVMLQLFKGGVENYVDSNTNGNILLTLIVKLFDFIQFIAVIVVISSVSKMAIGIYGKGEKPNGGKKEEKSN